MEVRAIKESEREECLQLWCTVWPGEGSRAYFERYFYGDVEWLPYYTQVAVVEGKLVSAVQICKRTVACGDGKLTMGGIANVATLPDYRGKGYNTACLQGAIRVMEADAMDFSLLFTGINDYYARQGFADWPREQREGVLREDFTPRSTRYAVRPASPEDMPDVRALYDRYNVSRPIAVQRYEAYWRDWMSIRPGSAPDLLYVATEPSGALCGYAQCGTFRSAVPYSADEEGVRITEFAAQTGDPEREREITAALLDGVAQTFIERGARALRLDIALESAVLDALESILHPSDRRMATSGMVRVLHRENLLQSFAMGANDRWIAAGRPAGILTFVTPYGAVRLDATGPFLHVASTEELRDALSQSVLFGLLFGSLAPEQTTADAALHPLMEAVFPRQAPVYWGADGF